VVVFIKTWKLIFGVHV